ncbi:NUDIX hydrolase [Yoonia sp. 208BN28-4]|uniref:NUDIX hydrolase n=1 Tax=Yoonia sp. 208BN28-4 TaxID=3126505 RepID=UPI0030A73EC5
MAKRTKTKPKVRPLHLRGAAKTDVRTQFAALCWRVKGKQVQVCLITSRNTKRWIVPKGWPMHKQTPASAAATEAWEEAGLTGKASNTCLGVYSYRKPIKKRPLPILVLVYPVKVKNVHSDWPEKDQRRRKWFTPAKAATKVAEPALQQILRDFDPALLSRS